MSDKNINLITDTEKILNFWTIVKNVKKDNIYLQIFPLLVHESLQETTTDIDLLQLIRSLYSSLKTLYNI